MLTRHRSDVKMRGRQQGWQSGGAGSGRCLGHHEGGAGGEGTQPEADVDGFQVGGDAVAPLDAGVPGHVCAEAGSDLASLRIIGSSWCSHDKVCPGKGVDPLLSSPEPAL